jgi:hypothetical protein
MRAWFLSLCTATALCLVSSANAQTPEGGPRAPGTAIIGLGLLGGEVAASVSTAFGVRKAPVLFAVTSGGLALGLVTGIFANRIKGPIAHDVVGVSSIVLGMGGIIPSVLLVLQIRSNDATKKGKKKKPDEETTALLVPPALLNLSEGEFHLSAPSIVPLAAKDKERPIGAVLFSGSF